MNAGLRSARRPLGMLLKQHRQQAAAPRAYSSAAPATVTTETPTTPPAPPIQFSQNASTTPTATPSKPTARSAGPYRTTSAVVLSRPPMLTPDLDPFEESFYFYQRRLNQRLALPFTRYFYFKKDTPADLEWKRKQKALGDDVFTGFGKRSWADELLVGDESHKSDDNGFRRLAATTVSGEDATAEGVEGVKKFEMPLGRTSKADMEGDRRSLDRHMTRTLYLLVRKKGRDRYAWKFPQSPLVGFENLKEAAERTLAEAAGVNMNTWFVGNVPIGHSGYRYPKGYTEDGDYMGKKVFYMKARIMAGQADLAENKFGLDDFMWLTKEEVDEVAGRPYFNVVKDMLVNQ